MRSILIVVTGWLGDCLFASSIAQKLIEEGLYDNVDYLLGFPQTTPILALNPHIRNIFIAEQIGPHPDFPAKLYGFDVHNIFRKESNRVFNYDSQIRYDKIVVLPVNDLSEPPTVKFQRACGVHNPTTEFNLDINVNLKIIQEMQTIKSHSRHRLPLVGICQTWKQADESLRDADEIEEELSVYGIPTAKIGSTISQFEGANPDNVQSYYDMACRMVMCDYVVGAEGGLLNLASGLGVSTICATDFTWALFGPQGRLQQYPDPFSRITPSAFFPDNYHVNLHHFITDNRDIADAISQFITD